MRLELIIPDSLATGAQRAAAASGQSLEAYMADALQLRLQDDPEDDMGSFFTPEVVANIREAATEARMGNNISFEQHKAEMKKMRAEWQANHPD